MYVRLYVCMYGCMYVCTVVCMYGWMDGMYGWMVWMDGMYVWLYVWLYVCMYACNVYIHAYLIFFYLLSSHTFFYVYEHANTHKRISKYSEGEAYFGLKRYDDALLSFRKAGAAEAPEPRARHLEKLAIEARQGGVFFRQVLVGREVCKHARDPLHQRIFDFSTQMQNFVSMWR